MFEAHFAAAAYSTDNILTTDEVWERYSQVPYPHARLSKLDVEVVLIRLEIEKRVVVGKAHDGTKVVKFLNPREKVLARPRLTEVDLAVHGLKATLATLSKQVSGLEAKQRGCTLLAKESLQAGHKEKALVHLKRRKFVEGILQKRAVAVGNIEEIILGIQGAETDQQVVAAYNSGKVALEGILAKGPTAESVDELLDDVRDLMANADEIQAALGAPLVDDADDSDLERELEGFLVPDDGQGQGQVLPQKESESQDPVFPQVPTASPVAKESPRKGQEESRKKEVIPA